MLGQGTSDATEAPRQAGRGEVVTKGHGPFTDENIKFTLEPKGNCLAGMRIF